MLSILPYFLINVSLIFLESYFRNLICCSILPISRPKAFSLKLAALLAGIWAVKNYVLSSGIVWGDILSILVFLTVLPLATEKGYRLKGLLTSIFFITIEVAMINVVAMVAFPVAESLGYSSLTLVDVKSSFGNAVMVLICLPAVLIPTWIAGRLLKKSFSDREFSFWILCFLPIPISQCVILNLINRLRPHSEGIFKLDAEYLFAFLLCIAADICLYYGARRVQNMELLREQVRLAEEQLEVQNGYYRQLQENILTVNQIRHDLTNQLQAAYVLMEQGEQQQVSHQLDQLREQIRNRIGPRFCENLMVDAVLSEKARLCRERGIELDINAQLPAELPIENVYLCSAFANLLDNSINACRTEPKQIRMQAALQGDYLLIRCTNPAALPAPGKGKSELLRSHGLGLDILRKIAETHHGSLDTTYRDGIFVVDLILKCTD